MKKIISILCIMVLTVVQISFFSDVAPLKADAAIDYTCGENLTWSLDVDTGEFVISGTGEMNDYSGKTAPWYDYRLYIKTAVIEEGVTCIGKYALYYCSRMTSIELPSTLVKIGERAFYGTAELKNITFPSGSNLMFANPDCFEKCKWYESQKDGAVYFGSVLIEYRGTAAENTSLTVKSGTKAIESHALENCSGINNIKFPDSLIRIGDAALNGTGWLEKQPNGLVCAGKVVYTYKGNMDLEQSVTVPEGIVSLASKAFYGCDLLAELILPSTLIYVGNRALDGTNLLRHLDLPSGLKFIEDYGFNDCGVTELLVPAGLEYVGKYAFSYCSNLKSVDFEKGYSLTSFPECMFEECRNLTSIRIPECTETIERGAFWWCCSITEITIPKSVISIGKANFYYDVNSKNDITISCYRDSAAHLYAVEKGFNYILIEESEEIKTESIINIITRAESINRNLYSVETLAKLDAAISAVDLNAENLSQSQVDEWETAIKSAFSNLKYKPADYYAVEIAQERAENLDRLLYTSESLEILDYALASVEENLDITNQSEVNSTARAINEAIDNLEYLPADYAKVDNAISESGKYDRRLYSQATLAALDQSISGVEYGLKITEQAKVDGFAEQINNAISALEYADIVLRNEPHGVIVSATAKEIDPDTALTVDLKDSSDLQSGNFAVGGTVKSITLYDINLLLDAQKTQPNGFVTVKIKLPDGVEPKRCKVYHVIDDPVDPLVRYTTALEGNFIVFETDHFSEFAVIEIETVLDSIEITKLPNKTVYALGETVNTSGLEVTAHYSDGSAKIVSDYDVSSVDTSSIGTKTITVYHTYNGITKSDSFEIKVNGDKIAANITLNGEDINEYNKKVAWYKGYSSESVKLDCVTAGNYRVEWSSDNSKVLVDSKGNVTNKGFFFARKATITVKVTDSAGNVLATDSIIVRFYKLSLQLSSIQSTMVQMFKKSGLIY